MTKEFITNKNTTFSITVPDDWSLQQCIMYANEELSWWNMYVVKESEEIEND